MGFRNYISMYCSSHQLELIKAVFEREGVDFKKDITVKPSGSGYRVCNCTLYCHDKLFTCLVSPIEYDLETFLNANDIKLKNKDMKRVILENKQEEVYLSDLTNASHVGFVDDVGDKGYVANICEGKFSIVSAKEHKNQQNDFYRSEAGENLKDSLKESLKILYRSLYYMKELYVFENRKALYKWLSE